MIDDKWRDKYETVINSFRWRGLKMRLLSQRGKRCQRCNQPRWPLELHHKTYERLGEERDDDLELLCSQCHVVADEERAEAGRVRASEALDDARFYGWCRAVYGEDYEPDDLDYERYEEWLERKEEYQ
jgi:hypothetical protein